MSLEAFHSVEGMTFRRSLQAGGTAPAKAQRQKVQRRLLGRADTWSVRRQENRSQPRALPAVGRGKGQRTTPLVWFKRTTTPRMLFGGLSQGDCRGPVGRGAVFWGPSLCPFSQCIPLIGGEEKQEKRRGRTMFSFQADRGGELGRNRV